MFVQRRAFSTGRTIFVGISGKNFGGSALALQKAFDRSASGDRIVAATYPTNAIDEMDGSGLSAERIKSIMEHNLSAAREVLGKAEGIAAKNAGAASFSTHLGNGTGKPHRELVKDAAAAGASTIYVGYNMDSTGSYMFGTYVAQAAKCDVLVVKTK